MKQIPNIPTLERRKVLCEAHGLNEDYLYQCLTGRRNMSSVLAASLEKQTRGEITRQMLRQSDYWLIWPDLPMPKSSQKGRGRATTKQAGV